MNVLSIIIGILLVICGFSCMFTPIATFLSTGYYLLILLLVYGIFGIIRYFQKQSTPLNLIVSILAVIVGILCLIYPGTSLEINSLILKLIAVWLIIQGVVNIVTSVSAREEQKGWGWGVFVGILGILVGIYSFAHPGVEALTIGALIGLYFVEAGFDMIVMGSAIGAAKKQMKEVEAEAERK